VLLIKMAEVKMRWLFLLILLALVGLPAVFMAGCQQGVAKTDKPAVPAMESAAKADTETQLKINQETLLRGATEDVRLDAAMVMLFSDSPRARQILIDTLRQSDNKPARVAVCKALVAGREMRRQVRGKRDFIGPLAEVLRTEEGSTARSAAEAALLFDYDEIANVLEPMAKDASLPVKARLNAIYALKVQLDIRAITRLVELVDDKNAQVASAARDSLHSIGVPVGKDARSRVQILTELRARGMDKFQRDWMVRQESKVSDLEKERDLWRKMYLGALDKIYEGLGDEGQKGKLLTDCLGNSEGVVRLWALDKVSQWRIGTQSKLPAELVPVLAKLISDTSRDVRLATAKLLSMTGELSSPERLAEQFKLEQDEEVKLELFVALGAACHYALVPTSGTQLSPELRRQTLEWAAGYLDDDDAKKSYRGAEVIRKLLEPAGLPADEAAKYMDLLVARYKRSAQTNAIALRGELLGTMARLCGQSVYRPESARRFAGLFEEALGDETDLVREAAVDGLICVDKPKAMKLLAKDFVNDHSQVVRNRIIELAGEIGGKDDLSWLWDKVGTNAESKTVWQAMLKIFNGCDVNAIESWVGKFDSQVSRQKLADEQWISFLELAQRKAVAENRDEMAMALREKLAWLYSTAGQFEQAAECLGKLREAAKTTEQKDAILGQLLEVYLRWPKVEAAAWLIGNCLLEKDLGADSAVVRSIESFWDNPAGGADPNAVLKTLRRIKPAERRPMWEQNLSRWGERFGSMGQEVDLPAGGE
jgi:HEAT repeat protein